MPLFFEAVDDKLKTKTTVIPKNIHNLALKVKGEYGNDVNRDGYKTVNRLLDSSYNKKSKNKKNDESPKVDKNDGLTKFPTSTARKMLVDLDKQDGFIDPKAKEQIKSYLKSDVKSKENAVKQNSLVPKVKPNSKIKPTNVSKVKNDAKVGNLNVSVSEGKTIYVSESHLKAIRDHIITEMVNSSRNRKKTLKNALNEYHSQLKLPFNHDSENYDFKYNYEQYIDALEDIGKYGQLQDSGYHDINDIVTDFFKPCFDTAASSYIDMDLPEDELIIKLFEYLKDISVYSTGIEQYLEDDIVMSLYDYAEERGGSYRNDSYAAITFHGELGKKWNEEHGQNRRGQWLISFYDFNKVMEENNVYSINDIRSVLKDYDSFEENFHSKLSDEGEEFLWNLTLNDRGLIYVEREISIPGAVTKNPSGIGDTPKDDQRHDSFYNKILKYGGVGDCWSWSSGGSESYCATRFYTTSYLTLKGWVRPQDINWEETIYRNMYGMKCEQEIYIGAGGTVYVELEEVVLRRAEIDGKVYNDVNILKKPIVVPNYS